MPSETPSPSKSGHENDIQNGIEDEETVETVETPELDDQPEPFPANTSTLPADYSDVPSSDHQDSSKQRRKHQRGGRKKKSEELQSVSESHLPAEDNEESYDEERETPQPAKPKLKHRDSKPPFDTGIRAFNLKRAESSGGRPFGISVGDKKSKNKPKTKSKSKTSSRRRKQKEPEREEEKEHWESETNEESESEEEEEEKPQQQKPFSIRLDLNLELEIFLRAKIKGDVTITFL
jgi:hypothetical protein